MNLSKKRVSAVVGPSLSDPGEFDVILSNDTLDRDGEVLLSTRWKQPLPESIQFNVDHSDHVRDIVGSGAPFIDDAGNLRVRGKFASSELGQHIRGLVNERHLRWVSVEFLRHKDGTHELVGGAFVKIPSHPTARVLASKAANGDAALIQAVHDAAYWLGAACAVMDDGVVVEDIDLADGAADGANKAAVLRLLRLKLRS